MSEFNIEEKANAYDLALNKAKTLLSKCKRVSDKALMIYRAEDIESIFPELKEVDDEQIRKWLISQLEIKSDVNNSRELELMILKSIDWLEKQGEQIDIANKEYWRGYREGKQETLDKYAELEKQGQETVSQSYLSPKSASQAIKEIIVDNANKVEPKFHEGDWVAINPELRFASPLYIKDIDKSNYRVESLDGNSGTPTIDYLDNHYHLWTIKDAKDGDVLWHSDSASNGIFIFKEIRDDGKVLCYCDYDSEDHFCLGEHHTCCWSHSKYVKPATEKQCKFLFQKMQEAGYEWNVEKKELKNLKEESENYKQQIMSEMADLVKNYIRQKSAWTEEDEKKRTLLIKILEVNHPHGIFKVNSSETIRTEELVSWLKSLNS